MNYDATSAHVFGDLLRERVANSPVGWTSLAGLLDDFARIIQGRVLPNLTTTVRAAEDASAILFCAVLVTKRENIELGFQSLINEAPGRSFGAKLINWAMSKMDADIADDLKVAWGSLHQQMSSTIEMLIRQLEPNILPHSPPLRMEQVVSWIQIHGGIGKLHMEYMAARRTEKQMEQANKEADRRRGAQARRLQDAQEAGYDGIEAYETALAEREKQQRETSLRSKFEALKKRLVQNGSVAADKVPENRLLITHGGNLYLISDEDEFSLLSCGAAIL
jgi:hypothetical protein